MKEKIVPVVAIIALVLSLWSLLSSPYVPTPISIPSPTEIAQKFGAVGGMLAEQYLPYVRYNGGYKTELSLSVGSTTPKDIINIGGGRCDLRTDSDGVVTRTFKASTTKMHYCTALGVRPGDQVFITLPSSSLDVSNASSSPLSGVAFNGSISVVGAVSTSSDLIGVLLYNSTGIASSSYAVATTGAAYLFFR